MKASDLIALIEKEIKENGDCEIERYDDFSTTSTNSEPVTEVYWSELNDKIIIG